MLCFVCVNSCPQEEHTYNIDSSQSWEAGSWAVFAVCCCPNIENPAVPSGCVGTWPNAPEDREYTWRLQIERFVPLNSLYDPKTYLQMRFSGHLHSSPSDYCSGTWRSKHPACYQCYGQEAGRVGLGTFW